MKKIYLFFTLITFSSLLMGQGVTTATLNGKVTVKSGAESLPGATIVATHQPSGTVFGTVSQSDGQYNIPNMRVGGPYKIDVSFVGYQTQSFGEILFKAW